MVDNSGMDLDTSMALLDSSINALNGAVANATNYKVAQENLQYQKDTNLWNERLMRESWAREDNAVQRRVADLKKAGLSPVLAAGSAAQSSSPVQMKSPHNDYQYSKFDLNLATALSTIKALKSQDLQNQLLQKQVDNYGRPDWLVAMNEIFGADKFMQILRGLGDKLYDRLIGSGSDTPIGNAIDAVTNPYFNTVESESTGAYYSNLFNHPDFYTDLKLRKNSDGSATLVVGDDAYKLLQDQAELNGVTVSQAIEHLLDWYNKYGRYHYKMNYL